MKIPKPLKSQFKFLLILSALLGISDLVLCAEIENFLTEQTIAACIKADEHKNYRLRYFHRKAQDRDDDIVVLMGEKHVKEDADESQRGREVISQFFCIGVENYNHFLDSSFQKFDPQTFLFKNIAMLRAKNEGRGSSVHEALDPQELFRHIGNAVAIGLSKAVKAHLNENETEKKKLNDYIQFDPNYHLEIVFGNSWSEYRRSRGIDEYLERRGVDPKSINSPINARNLNCWLAAIRDQENLLTDLNKDLVEQALVEMQHGKRQPGHHLVPSQKTDKIATRIDLEQGCRATWKDNIYAAANIALTMGELMALPAIPYWYLTGSSFAGTFAGIGFCLFALDMACEQLYIKGALDIKYVRRSHSLGIETRDKAMAQKINEFFTTQKDSQQFLAIMGMAHVTGVAEQLINTYGFMELRPLINGSK